jgi:TPR repeat protein
MSFSIFRSTFAAVFAFLLAAAIFTGCDSKTENAASDKSGNANSAESAGELEKGLAAYKQKDYKTAFGHFKNAAEQGDAEAQYRLADCYAKAKGVERDYEKAFDWNMKSAEQGYPLARLCVGFYYEGGIGVRRNAAEAEKWIKESFDAVLKLAEQGDGEAQLYLSTCYGTGRGVERDKKKALEWNRKAAENGIEQAQKNVGLLYLMQERNAKEAVKWLRMAAENGEQEAVLLCGLIYWGGDAYIFDGAVESTVAPDWNEAEKWFRTALNGPFAEEAKNALANMADARKQGKGPVTLEDVKSEVGEWVEISDEDEDDEDDEDDE